MNVSDPASPAVPSARRLTLFQRDDCHLCDLALEVLAVARAPEFDSVFIDEDEVLEQRYGVRVPVLRDESRGVELEWPFDVERVRDFLRLDILPL
ncbi:glutaredoxin family protein [Novilysobacter erysipheiresistens]|uniref:Glutaredoxin family protein n=1 Tax=Novilysobacter erysipheiresistens TaxID=1749332 RepID=A0ABU7Z1T1_9GAMM